jgi:hypothetical protein
MIYHVVALNVLMYTSKRKGKLKEVYEKSIKTYDAFSVGFGN